MPVESTPSKTLAPSRTVDQVLGQIPVGRYHYLLITMAGLVFMADALEVTLLSFLASCAGVEFDLTDAQMAMITTAVFIGQIVGNLIWGPIADKYGRRFAFLRSATMICVFSWLSGASPNFASLVVFRTFCGVGIGGSSVPFDLVAEFLPPEARGANLLSMEFLWTFGSLLVIAAAWIFLDSSGWRPLVYVTAAPMTIVVLVAIYLLPESPRWLVSKRRYIEAENIVRQCAETNGVHLEPFSFGALSAGTSGDPLSEPNPMHAPLVDGSSRSDSSVEINNSSNRSNFGGLGSVEDSLRGSQHAEVSSPRTPDDITITDSRGYPIDLKRSMHHSADSSRGDSAYNTGETWLGQCCVQAIVDPFEEWKKNVSVVLSDPEDRYSAELLAVIWIGFGFSYYGLILFVSRLYRESDGDDGTKDDLQTCHFDYGDIMLNASSEIPGTAAAMLIIDRLGRRITQSGFYMVGTLCLIIMGSMHASLSHNDIVVLSFFARAAAMASSCLTWVVTPELFKTQSRATMHSLLSCIARLGAAISPYVVVSNIPNVTIAIILGIVNALCALAAFLLRETMNAPLDEDKSTT